MQHSKNICEGFELECVFSSTIANIVFTFHGELFWVFIELYDLLYASHTLFVKGNSLNTL